MSKSELTWLIVGVVAGIIFAPQIRRIPGVNRIPVV